MKKIEISVCTALFACVVVAFFQIPFAKTCEEIRSDTLRLHVIANSDSEQDQEVKLCVRDAILEHSEQLFSDASSKEQAEQNLAIKINEIEQIAKQTLITKGVSYDATATVEDTYFNTREYEDFTLPAGTYSALKIELGNADGKNWWCVLYPTLCVPCATDQQPLEEYTEQEQNVVTGTKKYVIKFKIEELMQDLFGKKPENSSRAEE